MRYVWIGLLAAATGGAFMASTRGWGLPATMSEPQKIANVRRGSNTSRAYFFYAGSRGHRGGGLRHGK